jgi:hypothetical protein
MTCDGKTHCIDCDLFSSCPSNTRVFVNYCGSMPQSLRDLINHARIDCRVRRRHYRGVRSTFDGVTNAVVLSNDVNVLETHVHA